MSKGHLPRIIFTKKKNYFHEKKYFSSWKERIIFMKRIRQWRSSTGKTRINCRNGHPHLPKETPTFSKQLLTTQERTIRASETNVSMADTRAVRLYRSSTATFSYPAVSQLAQRDLQSTPDMCNRKDRYGNCWGIPYPPQAKSYLALRSLSPRFQVGGQVS